MWKGLDPDHTYTVDDGLDPDYTYTVDDVYCLCPHTTQPLIRILV